MSNLQENLIVWQKWYDPLGEDDIDTDSDLVNEIEPEFYDQDIPEETEEQPAELQFYSKPTKVILTPMGVIPYTENTASSKIFNFWLGHTNFNITPDIVMLIEQTDGIETLDIFTRYRFRISIGKVFDEKTVMLDINDRVYKFLAKE